HVFFRHVTRETSAALPARIVMSVPPERVRRPERSVACRANTVSENRAEVVEPLPWGSRMRVVARRACHAIGTAAEDEVARLAGIDVAATRRPRSQATLPSVRVLTEENRMAARTRAVDPRCPRGFRSFRSRTFDAQDLALELERRAFRRIVGVSLTSVVTRFASDSELDEVSFVEALACFARGF